MAYELPCDHCLVRFPVDYLVDASDLEPMYARVCEECEAELVAELHDDDTCDCSCCERRRERADRIRDEAEKNERVRHGISPLGMELLGWTEEDL